MDGTTGEEEMQEIFCRFREERVQKAPDRKEQDTLRLIKEAAGAAGAVIMVGERFGCPCADGGVIPQDGCRSSPAVTTGSGCLQQEFTGRGIPVDL